MKHDWDNYLMNGTFSLLEDYDMNDSVWNLVEFLNEDKPTKEMYHDCKNVVEDNDFNDIKKWVHNHREYDSWVKVLKEVEDRVNKKPLKEQPPIVKHWHSRYLYYFRALPYSPYNYSDYLLKAFNIAEKGLKKKKSKETPLPTQQKKKIETFFRVLEKNDIVIKSGSKKYTLIVTKTFYIKLVKEASEIIFGNEERTYFAPFQKYLVIKNEKQTKIGASQENHKYTSKVDEIIYKFKRAILTI